MTAFSDFYTWVACGKEGEYTIAAIINGVGIPPNMALPLVSPDRALASSFKALAVSHGVRFHEPVRLLHFSDVSVIEEIMPG